VPKSLIRLKIGLILAGLALAVWPLPPSVSPWFFGLCIVLTGIPHGAIDHVLHRHYTQAPAWRVSLQFYGEYFAWIGLGALLWWLWPAAAVVGFFAVSAYHFGQTQLAYLPRPQASAVDADLTPALTSALYPRALYVIWGALAVSGFVLTNSTVLTYGFTQVIPVADVAGLAALARPYVEVAACVAIILLVVSLHKRPNVLLLELVELTTLALVFLRNDFYTSFGLFFGGWHALNAMHHALRDVGRFQRFSLWQFGREAVVHSAASLGGIALLVWGAVQWQTGALTATLDHWARLANLPLPSLPVPAPGQAWGAPLLVFMALSVLAFPHIVVLEQWYAFLGRKPQESVVPAPETKTASAV